MTNHGVSDMIKIMEIYPTPTFDGNSTGSWSSQKEDIE